MAKLTPEEKMARKIYKRILRPQEGDLTGNEAGCPLCNSYINQESYYQQYGRREKCGRCPLIIEKEGCMNSAFKQINCRPTTEDFLAIMVYLHGFVGNSDV